MVPNGGPPGRVIQPNDNIDTRLIGEEGLDEMDGGGSRGSLKTFGRFSSCFPHVVVDVGHILAQATKSPERREIECSLLTQFRSRKGGHIYSIRYTVRTSSRN